MARTGRPTSGISRVRAMVMLLPEHHAVLERLDKDILTDKRTYGARNKHIDKALSEYFQKYYPELVSKKPAPVDSKDIDRG